LTNKPERRPSSRAGVKLEKLPEKTLNQSRASLPRTVMNTVVVEDTLSQLKNIKLS